MTAACWTVGRRGSGPLVRQARWDGQALANVCYGDAGPGLDHGLGRDEVRRIAESVGGPNSGRAM